MESARVVEIVWHKDESKTLIQKLILEAELELRAEPENKMAGLGVAQQILVIGQQLRNSMETQQDAETKLVIAVHHRAALSVIYAIAFWATKQPELVEHWKICIRDALGLFACINILPMIAPNSDPQQPTVLDQLPRTFN